MRWSSNTVAKKKVIMYWWLTGKRVRKWDREKKRGRGLSTHYPGNKVLSRKQRCLPGRWMTLWGGRWGLELLHINHWARTLWKIPAVLMEKRGRGPVAGERLRGSQPTSPNPPFTLLQRSQGLAASGPLLKYISFFRGCLNETSGLKNHTVCGSINTSSPTMATQQVPVSLSPSTKQRFRKQCFIHSNHSHSYSNPCSSL